jgi:lipopolysaccharide transport system ATP-binding protein
MSNIAIKAENLSKAYQLGEIGTGTISRDLERWFAKVRGKEDPFLRIGETNDRTSKGTSNIVWSLKDINFEIEQGDAVGIIGRNGAGKSTLLKILSKVTSPTTGKISGKGRIASLLEVGTGFHPELTGRENIFLNGAILGMRKHEIKKHFDAIVDFAGVERYIDTPVKRYSSGMYVRLAFAVAAHLESEILIVDEVLAVGDAEFQKKCLGKMGEVSKGEGRTVLFVSHNMSSVIALCNRAILLEKGKVSLTSDVKSVISLYLNTSHDRNLYHYAGTGVVKEAQLIGLKNGVSFGSAFELEVLFSAPYPISNLVLGVVFKDDLGNPLVGINNRHYSHVKLNSKDVTKGLIKVHIPKLKLLPGRYTADLFLGDSTVDIAAVESAITFTVEDTNITDTPHSLDYTLNKVYHDFVSWTYHEINN